MGTFHIDGDTVKINGDISISVAESLLNLFRDVGPVNNRRVIDLKGVESWDSSSVQIFLSYIKSYDEEYIRWVHIPDELRDNLRAMGILTLFREVDDE